MNQVLLEETYLRAPFAGIVAEINGEIGEYVTPSPPGVATPPAVDLIDYSCLYVTAPIDEVDAGDLHTGLPARVSLDAFRGETSRALWTASLPMCWILKNRHAPWKSMYCSTTPVVATGCWWATAPISISFWKPTTTCCACPPKRSWRMTRSIAIDRDSGTLELVAIEVGIRNWNFTEVTGDLRRVMRSCCRWTCRVSLRASTWCPGMIEVSASTRPSILGDSEVRALDDINLRIEQGDYLSVMGPSGSGKSTLLNMLGLLDRPIAVSYLLNGVDTMSLDENERARLRREQIGFVFQSYHLIARLTARENIEMP